MNRWLLILSAMLLLAGGCANSLDQLIAADYGPQPTEIEAKAKAYFEDSLKDPESARYKFSEIRKGWYYTGLMVGNETRYGWVLPVSVNAKNSYGGYTGFKSYYLFFWHGRIIDITMQVGSNLGGLYY